MPTITLSIPEDLKKEMDENKFFNWSEIARSAIKEKLQQAKILREISKKSNLSEKDADMIAKQIKKSLHKRYEDQE
jgi:Arc/MetJ-type ribon-helix-helix transcriptional regulator